MEGITNHWPAMEGIRFHIQLCSFQDRFRNNPTIRAIESQVVSVCIFLTCMAQKITLTYVRCVLTKSAPWVQSVSLANRLTNATFEIFKTCLIILQHGTSDLSVSAGHTILIFYIFYLHYVYSANPLFHSYIVFGSSLNLMNFHHQCLSPLFVPWTSWMELRLQLQEDESQSKFNTFKSNCALSWSSLVSQTQQLQIYQKQSTTKAKETSAQKKNLHPICNSSTVLRLVGIQIDF